MVTIARGPAPPSRWAVLGQQAGAGLGLGLIQSIQQQQEAERAQQEQDRAQAEALRQLDALVAVLSGQSTAGQNPLAAATVPVQAGSPPAPLPAPANPLASATAMPPAIVPTDGSPMRVPIVAGPLQSAQPAASAPAATPAFDPARVQALLANREALASLLAGTKPEDMLQAVQTLLQGPQAPEPYKVGVNERLIDPLTKQEIVSAVPKAPEPTTELARLRVEMQRGYITPEEFRIRRQRILNGEPPAPRQAARDFDVILPDGSRIPAVGEVRGSQVLVADPQGNFRPLTEVFPNAVRVEQTIRRTQEIEPPPTPFTREEFVQPRQLGGIDAIDEAAGPVDRAMAIAARVPGFGQTLQALLSDDFGLKERAGNRIFTQLENRVASAFRPGEDSRMSNQEMEMALRLVPRYGAFATEAATTQDLQTLRDMANSLMERSLQVANQPDRFDPVIVRSAQQRLIELGDVLSMVDSLLLARESGVLTPPSRGPSPPSRSERGQRPAAQLTPQQVQSLPPEQLQQVVDSMSEDDLRQLDDETLRILSERLGGAQ